jgi:hypothetical protein
MKHPFHLLLTLSLSFALARPAVAAPEITVEVGGNGRLSGSLLRLAAEAPAAVTDPVEFQAPQGTLDVAFPHVTAGDYTGQFSTGDDFWSDVTPLLHHPAGGTLSFVHNPGPVATARYRLIRLLDSCQSVTIRNTGDSELTGIAASLGGPDLVDFSLDDSNLGPTLAPGASTTLTVCFNALDLDEHLATLNIASDDADEDPFTLALVGDNDPGPIIVVPPVPTITVFSQRTTFEAAIGPARITDDFSGVEPLLPVSSERGLISGEKWSDVARDPEPSTVWRIPFGTTGWGGIWDLTASGTGGGLSFELDFGGGNFVEVPGNLPGGTPADVFFGFTSDLPFYGVRIRQFDSQGNTIQETHTFDDLVVAVPVGGEIALHDGATTAAPQLADGQVAPLDFGVVERGVTTSRTLTLANSGTEPLQVVALSTGGNFQIANAPALPFTVDPGASANFEVVFLSASGGTFGSRVDVWCSDADETRFDFNLSATVTPDARLQLINSQNGAEVTDGQATVIAIQPNPFGGGSSVSLNLNNVGLDPLVLTGVSLPAGFQIFKSLPLTILPGQSDFLSFTSVGPAAGFYSGDVTLTTNDSVKATLTFPISALFDMPEIEVQRNFSPVEAGATVDLGSTPLGQKKNVSFVVRNLHAGPLTVTGVTLPPGYALAAFAPAFPFTLTRNQTREIPVELTALAPGIYSGTFAIANNDHDEGPFNLTLSGEVLAESITFFGFNTSVTEGGSTGAFAFGSGPVTYQWDLDGDGEFDDAVGSEVALPDTDGPGTFAAALRMTDSLSSIIRTGNIPIVNRVPFPQATLPESLTAGTAFGLDISAIDASADRAAGMAWRIDWGDGSVENRPAGHPSDTSFSHVFTQPGRATIDIEVTDKDGATGSESLSVWVHSGVIGVFDGPDATGPELRDGESGLSFSTVAGGTRDRPLTVLNRGAGPASIGPVTLPAGFSLVAPPAFPAALAPGASLTLTLRFAPPAGGEFGGAMVLGTSDPLMPAFDLDLTGSAAAPDIAVSEFSGERFDFASGEASFSVSPGTLSFSGLAIQLESANSEAPLVISAIDLPPNFQLGNPPAFPLDFASESSTSIRIQCNAVAPGFYEGWVSIHSNDPDESPFRFFVTSNVGNVADLLVKSDGSGISSATGLILNGQDEPLAPPLQLRLRNQGGGTIQLSAITLPDGFAFASPPALPATLSPSASVTLPPIVLSATTPGVYSGDVVITSTDPDENPFHFALSATVPGVGPPEPDLTAFSLTPATSGTGVVFAGDIAGPPAGTVVVEGSRDLDGVFPWVEIARVTLDATGHGSIGPTSVPDTLGVPRYFVRLRLLSP